MVFLPGLVGFLFVLTAEAKIGKSVGSSICTETKECLDFDLICETENYEVRHYDSAKWVSTQEESYFMEMATSRAFRRLFKYITGANANGTKIDMTTPVLIDVKDKPFWKIGNFTMSFLLPSEYQEDPPQPTDPSVYLHETPDMNVYVRSYGGWMTTFTDTSKASGLSQDLKSAGAKFNKQVHYAVGYNSPMTLLNRRNEVWFFAEDDPVCSSSSSEESV
ncbi:heme-binding protein 2-like [Salarias fasciatus]|uniref:Heme-binding protein 1 n=1 Tax=Salarias fasciatus TaxID=181472 RepID=A0A672HA96_SALFA|nr:heme-binding protein 2-like [Salarias fasciatus]